MMKSDTKTILKEAFIHSFKKLNPVVQWRSPVMFIVYIGCLLSMVLWLDALYVGSQDRQFIFSIMLWLLFTILFANFAEAFAEGKSKAQSDALRGLKKTTTARRVTYVNQQYVEEMISSDDLRLGDTFKVIPGEIIPSDGEIVEGVASVDESAITGESAPVIRAAGSDFCSVTGGTTLVSDYLIVKVNVRPGESFLDKMISMVEGAKRQKTPNEIALTILLVALTITFILVVGSTYAFSDYSTANTGAHTTISLIALIALLVCLIPTTIGGLLSAIGIAGMNRMMKVNIIASSGKAVETSGNVDILLLDKTGTITFGNRRADQFYPVSGINKNELIRAAYWASKKDETPEGNSIVFLAERMMSFDQLVAPKEWQGEMVDVPFTAQTRMSGVNFVGDTGTIELRKGSGEAIKTYVQNLSGFIPKDADAIIERIASQGATPLIVSVNNRILGVVALKDTVKPGIRERFNQLRYMGIKTVMITGDNPLTAATIATEAGVDDYLAEATPENKLSMIRKYQSQGFLVAMTGDGTNDAPALAQADVAVAMNSGTQAAKEASNMVDLDSDPTKLIEIVQTGKQLLMTRGALTTFSIANDLAKYFAIIPALFIPVFPQLALLNVMHLTSPESAILSAVIFNALIIIFLIPLAMKGVRYRPEKISKTLSRNLLIYGLGGIITPFIGIKLIDMILTVL